MDCKDVLVDTGITPYGEKISRPFPWFLYFSSFATNLLIVTAGLCLVWSSPVMVKLQSDDDEVNPLGRPITVTEISALVSIPHISGVLGLLMWAGLNDSLGRRRTAMIISVCFSSNLIVRAFASNIYLYYCCLVVNGLGLSGSLIVVSVFNNEIAEDGNRGTMGCLTGLAAPTGILLGYLFAPITTVRSLTLICSVPSLLFLMLSAFIPESPVFLSMKGRRFEAIKTLEKLRNTSDGKYLEIEYEKIENLIGASSKVHKKNCLEILKNRISRKSFFICIGVCMVQQLSGIFCILSFVASIFNEFSNNLSGDSVGIIVGVVQMTMFLVTAFFIDNVGRRPFLLTSSIMSGVSLFFLGLYFYLKSIDSSFLDSLRWLPIASIILYIISYSIGLGPIPLSLTGEMFSNSMRSVGCASVLIFNDTTIFATLFIFPVVTQYFGIQYCIWFFSSCCFLGSVFIFLCLPETKGKSFHKIQEMLAR